MKLTFRIIALCLFIGSVSQLTAQRVTVSNETSMRTDYAYDILGQLDDRILLYRDKGNEKVVDVYDENLKFLYDRELQLPERRATIYGLTTRDSSFTIFSGYTRKKEYNLVANRFNKDVQAIDTVYIIEGEKDFKAKSFRFTTSEDDSKTLLFSTKEEDILYMYVIDNDSLELLWWKEVLVDNYDIRSDFRHAFISNKGDVNFLFHDRDKKRKKDKKEQFMLLGTADTPDVYVNKFSVDKKFIIDIICKYDKLNNGVILAGLASDDEEFDADSYFYFSKPLDMLEEENEIYHRNFDANFIQEVYGKKLGKKKRLKDFVTRDAIVRNDGGIILITEMEKEFYRRSSFNTLSGTRDRYGRGWVDIYNEDMILISINPDGAEHWKKILYKKQFSQDDEGAFSSFFIFENSSRIRLIYNDEIKQNSTVSEYVLDPLGRYERNSVLSTEYQSLKIRWRDGLQISPGIMLAPSEINNKLSLVKVNYNIKS